MAIPITTLDARYSSEGAHETGWSQGVALLEQAEVYWLTSVRPDGRPHTTPLIAVWLDGALYFATGPAERKARNLEQNRTVTVTTGTNKLGEGLDIVLEGEAARETDGSVLRRLTELYASKYGWSFEARDGSFWSDGREAYVFAVAPERAFGFAKGEPYSQTRWQFAEVATR